MSIESPPCRQEHAGNLTFPCGDCGYVGKFLHHLKAHRREAHTRDEDKQYQCPFCGKVSSYRAGLKVSLRWREFEAEVVNNSRNINHQT